MADQLALDLTAALPQDDPSLPRDCPSCKGTGERLIRKTGELVTCVNCRGTGRAVIPF